MRKLISLYGWAIISVVLILTAGVMVMAQYSTNPPTPSLGMTKDWLYVILTAGGLIFGAGGSWMAYRAKLDKVDSCYSELAKTVTINSERIKILEVARQASEDHRANQEIHVSRSCIITQEECSRREDQMIHSMKLEIENSVMRGIQRASGSTNFGES